MEIKVAGCVWQVIAYEPFDDPGHYIFDAYFSDRKAAMAVLARGEKEFGPASGYVDMKWALIRHYIDDEGFIDQMFDDVREYLKVEEDE
jgi:protoheme ferro-lyase